MTDLNSRISFGRAIDVHYGTNGDSPTQGGWINATVPVLIDGQPYAHAMVGCWVYTDHDLGPTADVHDECRRTGYAFRSYEGHDRQLELVAGAADVDLDDLLPDADDAEQELLSAAEAEADVDYDAVFAAALRERLEKMTDSAGVYDLIRAVRALEE